jgi:hypothetical protein
MITPNIWGNKSHVPNHQPNYHTVIWIVMTIMGWVYLNSMGQMIIIIPIELRYVRWCIMIIWEIMIIICINNSCTIGIYPLNFLINIHGFQYPKSFSIGTPMVFGYPNSWNPHMSSGKMRRYGYSHQRCGFNYETWVCCSEGASMNPPCYYTVPGTAFCSTG